ncbi:pectate lyase [Staphylococcus delphini]|uniref:glycosyl hydrolase family 28-related protein n=1 Tax=Staphylococcus delphini TaxID=53344 RepID=UPI000BBC931D|nr:glycosyl hydrolase family 28-related protein [Staphylococcus delphini]PCF71812.1 pectate lyase [Staphylococcus delphini]HEC2158497.1 pectate lyase [Staphylococcus delphini]
MKINVLDFGAQGQNRLLDTWGIQRALNQAKKGPITVYIPSGTYHIAKALKIYEGTTLILDPDAQMLRTGKDALLKNGSGLKRYYGYNGNSHIKIQGGIWNMNGVHYPYNNTAMCLGHAREIEVCHLTIKNVVGGHGIDACGLDGLHVHHCNFVGFYDETGERWFSEAVQLDLFVEGAFPKFGVNDGTITKNAVIEHCYFGNSFEGDMQSWNRAIGSHATRFDRFYENIIIQHNVFEDTQDYALTPLKGKNIFIQHNLFLNCAGGIRYLGVHQGKNAMTLEGDHEGKQGGDGLYVMHNDFVNNGSKDVLHIRSHQDAPHTDVNVIGNTFTDGHQVAQLTGVHDIAILNNEHSPQWHQKHVSAFFTDKSE